MTTKPITAALTADATIGWRIRAYQIAWGLALCFYFLEYASSELPPSYGNGETGDSSSSVPKPTAVPRTANIRQQPPTPQIREKPKPEDMPLGSFRIGDAVMEVGGFVDLENIYRTTNTQDNISTPFAAIPFNNTAQGRVSEQRTTAQFSRFSFKVSDKFAGNDVLGYLETDFSGNDAPGVYQTINPHTQRLRLYFMDLRHNKWELLGGQTWSWLTPNREGIGPMPVDLAITYTRSPWSVAPGDPKNAHLSMVYAGFRYVLPSSAGTLLRVPYPN